MSTKQRATHSSVEQNTDGRNGCALLLVFGGIGITLVAVCIGLFLAFFMIDAGSETIAVETDVIEEDMPVPSPAVIDEPTATPVPTSESGVQPDAESYVNVAGQTIASLESSVSEYLDLMQQIGERDSAWDEQFHEVITKWKTARDEFATVSAPEEHQTSYSQLLEATQLLGDAADRMSDNESSLNFAAGADSLTDGMIALAMARMEFDSERSSS